MNPTPMTPDDLDRTLAAYFRGQVPDPFPPCAALAEPPTSARVRGLAEIGSSRFALAASVAGLLGLGLLASSGVKPQMAVKTPTAADGGMLRDATANGEGLLKHVTPATKAR